MRLILSKIIRTLKNERIPSTCYASQWMPKSSLEICDCQTFCKFPPKGNCGIPLLMPLALLTPTNSKKNKCYKQTNYITYKQYHII